MGSDELPCDPELLHDGLVVADIVYHPRSTALLAAAREAGADILLIGGVHKMSTLVQWAKIQAIDTGTQRVMRAHPSWITIPVSAKCWPCRAWTKFSDSSTGSCASSAAACFL